MRGLAGELETDAHDAEQILVGDPPIPAVYHHRRVDALEDTAANQLHLAAATLLGRRADDVDPAPGKPLAHGGQAQAGAGAGRGDHVVTASVADAGQCVVLTHDGDRRPIARVQRGPERGVDASDAALDLEALGAEELDEPAGRLDFLVAELGMVVDLAGELLQLIARPVQRAGDLILDGAHARTSVGVSGPAHYTPSVVWYLPPREPWSRAGDRDSSDLRERTGRARTHP